MTYSGHELIIEISSLSNHDLNEQKSHDRMKQDDTWDASGTVEEDPHRMICDDRRIAKPEGQESSSEGKRFASL